jgi:site-specific recombinase XerD
MKTSIDYLFEYLSEQKLKTAWRNNLKSKLMKLINWLDEQDLILFELGARDAAAYAEYLSTLVLAKNTVCTLLTVATRFYNYLLKRKIIPANPFLEIRKPKMDKLLPRHLLKPKELDEYLEKLSRWEEEQNLFLKLRRYRVHVLAEFLYSSGMRIGEAASVKIGNIDLERGRVKVIDSKSRKEKLCFLNEYAATVLRIYLESLRKYYPQSERIFGAEEGRLATTVSWVTSDMSKRHGYPHLTCHSFRHSFGYHMLKAGCDMRYIQTFLGHESLKSTQIYTRVDKEDLKQVLDQCHPRTFNHTKAVNL